MESFASRSDAGLDSLRSFRASGPIVIVITLFAMTFAKWVSLSETEQENEKRHWHPFEPGYWHSLATEAAARFNAEFGSKAHITKVFKSLYHARELIVAVQTSSSSNKKIKLPASYHGFGVMQFANRVPDGVLVEPGLPSKTPRRINGVAKRHAAAFPANRNDEARPGSHFVLTLEGEIDLHVLPRVATELRARIKDKPEKLVIDFANVSYIDSAGLAVLIDGMQRIEAYHGKLYLVGLQEMVRTIFETSRLDQAFRIRSSVAEALAT